jgi:hypothetical protein
MTATAMTRLRMTAPAETPMMKYFILSSFSVNKTVSSKTKLISYLGF